MMENKVLSITGLTKTFKNKNRKFTAVNAVDIDILCGECVGLIGESGSGKTTIANIVAGLVQADAGEIIFQNKNLMNISGKELYEARSNMQMIFQNPRLSFNEKMTIFDSIMEGINYYTEFSKEDKIKRVYEAMEMVKLPKEYAGRYSFEISGGECQRAAIARAIIIRPRFLICDEITSALDVSVQSQIIKLLLELKEELGMSYLFISHDLALVKNFCNRAYVMYKGDIVEMNDTEQLFKEPKHEYTKLLIKSILTI